jgi:hypothetical protein
MVIDSTELSDEVFLTQFESQILPKECFNHIGHLRLAYLYLQKLELPQAIDKTSQGIIDYADSLGVKDKFHATITYAIVSLMFVRQSESPTPNWQAFIELNEDMATQCMPLLETYFSSDLLMSEKAKNQRVAPDKKPFKISPT